MFSKHFVLEQIVSIILVALYKYITGIDNPAVVARFFVLLHYSLGSSSCRHFR